MARFLARTKLNIANIKEVDEYKALIPENNQYEELKKAIQEQGFLFPVIVNKSGELLDGYTRLRIARELGITEIPVEIYETSGREEELDIIASLNLKRRQLSKDELVLLIDKIHEIKKKLRKTNELSQNETNTMSPHSISASGNEKNTTPSVTEESREILEELKRLVPDAEINPETVRYYFQVKEGAPWLIQYIGDHKKGKIGIRKAYDIYQLLKRKNLLDLNQRIPKTELDQLILTSDGRKVLEDDELLQQILDKKLAVSQAINIIKTKMGSSKPKKAAEPEEERGGPKRTKEGQGAETAKGGEGESVEVKQQLTPQFTANISKSQNEYLREPDRAGTSAIPQSVASDFLSELRIKGFAALPTEIALVKINGKCYAISVEALRDLEQGIPERWKELEAFLNKHGILIPGEVEGVYVVPWKLLGRCVEWK